MGSWRLGAFDRLVWQRLLAATTLGLVGFLLNLAPIPLFSNIQLVLGNIVIVICASRLGLGWVLWCAFLAISGLYLAWGHPVGYLLFGLEALCITLMRRRGWYLLYADLAYWLVLGMPLTAWAVNALVDLPPEYTPFTVLKQGFNGLLYCSAASLLLMLSPRGWLRTLRQQPILVRNFRQKLSHAVFALMILALFISLLAYTGHLMRIQQNLLHERLTETGERIALQYERYFQQHVDVVTVAGEWLPTTASAQRARLSQLHARNPGFITMLVTDNEGDVLAAAPGALFDGTRKLSVASRAYFRQVMATGTPYVSGVLQGRGFGQDPIVAISAPWFDHQGQIGGIIEGSLDVKRLLELNDINPAVHLVVIDDREHVVTASEQTGFAPLSDWRVNIMREGSDEQIGLLSLGVAAAPVADYFQHSVTLDNDWQLYILIPYRPFAQRAERQFLWGLGLLSLALLISVFLAQRLSRYLTWPLELLAKEVAQTGDGHTVMRALPRGAATEILLLRDQLAHQRNAIMQHQDELEGQVAARTQELALANKKLARLALRDGLTGAYNRRHFNQTFDSARQYSLRSHTPLVLALLDIDHFKAINDSHGHLVGDDCLKGLVRVIGEHFSRQNDLLVRYGGEEFLLLLPQLPYASAREQLDALRLKVAATPLTTTEQGLDLLVTISIGAIVASGHFSDEPKDWLNAADKLLYQAKSEGRDSLCIQDCTFELSGI
ncbi:diguanylate cyclase [Ferrimonas pelagia]|uniref:diguanylate cyclase n=1 Tax=Ferrimonas pelagia TaxID=1177826 RepID=A0ABP9EI04_9GAMM